MKSPIDIAWLAGIFDGEGCVYVLRVKRFSKKRGPRVVPTLELVIANTSTALVTKCVDVIRTLGVEPRVVVETKYGTRPICYVKVARKRDALIVARALEPYVTAKHDELEMAIWYLDRACKVRQHVATDQDIAVLDTIRSVKHGGVIPSAIKELVAIGN